MGVASRLRLGEHLLIEKTLAQRWKTGQMESPMQSAQMSCYVRCPEQGMASARRMMELGLLSAWSSAGGAKHWLSEGSSSGIRKARFQAEITLAAATGYHRLLADVLRNVRQ